MNCYLIYSPSSTYGQTDAGCHSVSGQESIEAFAGLASTDSEIASFVKEAELKLCFNLGDQTAAGDTWGEMFPKIEMPIPCTRAGLNAALKIGFCRRPNDPWIQTSRGGRHRIEFSDTTPELLGPQLSLDRANLLYQRGLLF